MNQYKVRTLSKLFVSSITMDGVDDCSALISDDCSSLISKCELDDIVVPDSVSIVSNCSLKNCSQSNIYC